MNMRHHRRGLTAAWKKSSHSGAHGDCVEVRSPAADAVLVRDSKDPQGPALGFTPSAWASFVADLNAGAFDRG